MAHATDAPGFVTVATVPDVVHAAVVVPTAPPAIAATITTPTTHILHAVVVAIPFKLIALNCLAAASTVV